MGLWSIFKRSTQRNYKSVFDQRWCFFSSSHKTIPWLWITIAIGMRFVFVVLNASLILLFRIPLWAFRKVLESFERKKWFALKKISVCFRKIRAKISKWFLHDVSLIETWILSNFSHDQSNHFGWIALNMDSFDKLLILICCDMRKSKFHAWKITWFVVVICFCFYWNSNCPKQFVRCKLIYSIAHMDKHHHRIFIQIISKKA